MKKLDYFDCDLLAPKFSSEDEFERYLDSEAEDFEATLNEEDEINDYYFNNKDWWN